MKGVSANFDFLGVHDAQLVRLGGLAELYFKDDSNTCLIKLRQFGEVLAQLTAASAGLLTSAVAFCATPRLRYGPLEERNNGFALASPSARPSSSTRSLRRWSAL